MLANSSDKTADPLKLLENTVRSTDGYRGCRLAMLALNFIPLCLLISTVLALILPYAIFPVRLAIAFAFLYLFPPTAARLLLWAARIRQGQIDLGTKDFLAWWTLFQLQVLFSRLNALEEVLRLVPGLYSQWLRLWGARIGRFTYWAPGTLITDRSFLSIGNDVVFGAGVRLNPHVIAKSKNGSVQLLLATVRVGDRATVGGYSLLTAGTEISAGETTRAFLISPPFSIWKEGKRVRLQTFGEFD